MHHPAATSKSHASEPSDESLPLAQQSQLEQLNPRPVNITSWFHLFTYKRFHVLLNSLFKVLCNFPSRYLFAIGLAVIFSLRWSLPPTLGCTLKQPDSSKLQLADESSNRYGTSTHSGRRPLSEGLAVRSVSQAALQLTRRISLTPFDAKGLGAELIPFRSPLLRESLLVSFPPLIYMLKFSG